MHAAPTLLGAAAGSWAHLFERETFVMKTFFVRSLTVASLLVLAAGCATETDADSEAGDVGVSADELRGPGRFASDARRPEIGNDIRVLENAKVTMAQGIAAAETTGPVIEAKYELDGSGALSLSTYPIGSPLSVDAERQVFQELAGDPTKSSFTGNVEAFTDQEHLTRSARDLTLIQLSKKSLSDAVSEGSKRGFVYWAIPTMRLGNAGYGVYVKRGGRSEYKFIDGDGNRGHNFWWPADLGTGPGAAATDARHPELPDLQVLKSSKISMFDALVKAEAKHGKTIEAKYELDDQGKLSLSIYPVGKGLDVDAERNTFFELAGDPTKKTFDPSKTEFEVPDAEHLTRSARELTIVQAAGIDLVSAVFFAELAMPEGSIVYWAIPTIRDTRAGYGVYVLGTDGKSHYFFIS
jgi:hypothetical protein